jgi:selT/selW/selH-like putative selenoprotein
VYEDYARALRSEFPHVTFRGEKFLPGEMKMALAQLLQFAFFGGIAIALIGTRVLPERAAKFVGENQGMVLGGCFMCNIMAGNLLSSGAFEITYNGEFVWSKIESGRLPQMDELRASLAAVGLS